MSLENGILANGQGGMAHLSVSGTGLPTRPFFGSQGTKGILTANYICATPNGGKLYSYSITANPPAVGRKLTQIVRLWLAQEFPDPGAAAGVATDFKSRIISRNAIPPTQHARQIIYKAEDEDTPRDGATEYTVALGDIKTLDAAELLASLRSSDGFTLTNRQEWTQAFNIVLNHASKSNPDRVIIGSGRVFSTTTTARLNLSGGIQAQRGFFSSARLSTGRLLVNVNVTHGAFYQSGWLLQVANEYEQRRRGEWENLDAFLRGLRVRLTHLPERRNQQGKVIVQARRIFGLAAMSDGQSRGGAFSGQAHPPQVSGFGAPARGVKFWVEDGAQSGSSGGNGRYVSVFDYFRQKVSSCRVRW